MSTTLNQVPSVHTVDSPARVFPDVRDVDGAPHHKGSPCLSTQRLAGPSFAVEAGEPHAPSEPTLPFNLCTPLLSARDRLNSGFMSCKIL